MAARREKLGGPPTPEELLAFRDGRLDAEERERLAARIAADPDAARALADLAAFPAVERAPGTRTLTEDEIGARWQAFRQRLPDRPAVASPPSPVPIGVAPRKPWWQAPSLKLAAAALVGLGVGWMAGSTGRSAAPGPAINVQIEELAPSGSADGVRSAESQVALHEGAEELVLVLGARTGEEREFPQYEVEVVDAAGRRAGSRKGLRPTALGTFRLSFPRGALPPGSYRIDLYGSDGASRTRLAAYPLRLVDETP